jgi:hypothetical protein
MNTPFGSSGETVIIPAVTLTGTREEKLGQLDDFLVQLHVVRRALACDAAAVIGDALTDEIRPRPRASHGWQRADTALRDWAAWSRSGAARLVRSVGRHSAGWASRKPKRTNSISQALAIRRGLWRPGLVFLMAIATPDGARAQAAPADPNPGRLTVTSSVDAVSTYMFRGIRQHATGMAFWPVADLGFAIDSGDGNLPSTTVNVGLWNSQHTGDTGADGPTRKLWYESDFYATMTLGFGGGASLATTYTAYTSPNNTFTTVKEVAFKLAVDDSSRLVALEFGTSPGVGQADGGSKAGRYLELGVAPGFAGSTVSLSVPAKLGLSLGNYYELNTATSVEPRFQDNTFGYFSVAGILTVPLGGTTSLGAWNVHGGVEYQALGETTEALNGGDASRVVGSIGIGFSY